MNIENNIPENPKEAIDEKIQDLEEAAKVENEVEGVTSKVGKLKRNPFEKVLDDSLRICEDTLQKDTAEINLEKLLQIFEREVMKKEEYYKLYQLFEKTKKLQGENADSKDTQTKTNIASIQNDLLAIRNTYENKKKVIGKKVTQEAEEAVPKELEPPSKKKKKVNSKKQKDVLDNTEVVKKIEEMENKINVDKEEVIECQSPKPEINRKNSNEEMTSPRKDEEDNKENKLVKIDPAQKKGRDSEKKIKQEKKEKEKEKDLVSTNKITNFFQKRPESCIKETTNNINSIASNKSKISNSNIQEKNNVEETNNNIKLLSFDANIEINNKINSIDLNEMEVTTEDKIKDPVIKDTVEQINPQPTQEMFNIIKFKPNKNLLEFNEKYTEGLKLKENAKAFYNIKGKDISYKEEDLNNYKDSYRGYIQDSMPRVNKKDVKRKKRIIFIHDSFILLRKFNEKTSNLINPRNPFKKDDYLIDYDKDSEEEFLEENAEDINSKENSADEEEINEEEEDDEKKWIVPDGHLSEDEVSEKDTLLLYNTANANTKIKSVMDLLEIRKNYTKPVVVNFNINIVDSKVKFIGDLVKARIFTQPSALSGANLLNNNEELPELPEFPIKITSKNKIEETGRKSGMNMILKDRLDEVVKEIHFSFMTKEYLIKLIAEKIPNISKKGLDNFFKDSCLKSKKAGSKRTQWLVKKEILDTIHISSEELAQLYEKQNQIFEEKEKERKKELLMNEENNQNLLNEVRQVNNQNQIKEVVDDNNTGPGLFNLGSISLKLNNPISQVQSQPAHSKINTGVINNFLKSAQSESRVNNNFENVNNTPLLNFSNIKQTLPSSQNQKEQNIEAILNNTGSKSLKKKIKPKQIKDDKNADASQSVTKKRVKSNKPKEEKKLETDEEKKDGEIKEKSVKSKKVRKLNIEKNGETSEKKIKSKSSFKKKKTDTKLDDNQATISQFQFDLNKIKLNKSTKAINQPLADSETKDPAKKENENM